MTTTLKSLRVTFNCVGKHDFIEHVLLLGYYGYWYDEDVYPLDPSSEAMKTNTLMEISLAASWLASLVWLGLGVYIMIVSKRTEDYNRSTF